MEAVIEDNPQNKKNRVFFAKLWINTITKEGENKGKKFMSGNIDNKFKNFTIGANDQINIWPNKKREGIKDADFRVSLLTDQDVPENINGPAKEEKEIQTSEIEAIMA
jgi:hypothetical protein